MEHFPIQNSRFDHLNERFRLLANGRNCYSIENILEIKEDQQFKVIYLLFNLASPNLIYHQILQF